MRYFCDQLKSLNVQTYITCFVYLNAFIFEFIGFSKWWREHIVCTIVAHHAVCEIHWHTWKQTLLTFPTAFIRFVISENSVIIFQTVLSFVYIFSNVSVTVELR